MSSRRARNAWTAACGRSQYRYPAAHPPAKTSVGHHHGRAVTPTCAAAVTHAPAAAVATTASAGPISSRRGSHGGACRSACQNAAPAAAAAAARVPATPQSGVTPM